jgi:hypothetical protein
MIENIQVGDKVKVLHTTQEGRYEFLEVVAPGYVQQGATRLPFAEQDVFECQRRPQNESVNLP